MKNKIKKDNWKTAWEQGGKYEKQSLWKKLKAALEKGEQWAKELIREIENG